MLGVAGVAGGAGWRGREPRERGEKTGYEPPALLSSASRFAPAKKESENKSISANS